MIAEETKDFAWSELLEVEKHVRYYDELASRYRRKSSVAKLLIFFLSLAIPAVSTSIHSPPSWILLVAGLLAAGLVAWDYTNGHEGKAAVLQGISYDCAQLQVEQRDLYHLVNRGDIDHADARSRLQDLARRTIEATARAAVAQVTIDRELNEKCWSEAIEFLGEGGELQSA